MGRIIRTIWISFVMWITSFLPDFTPVLRFRGMLIKPALKRCGKNFQVAKQVYIIHPNKIVAGNDVFLAYGAWVGAGDGLTFEDEVMLGPYSVIITGDHGLLDGSYRFGHGECGPVVLKKGCWIGAHATVTKGVTIGTGALLGANAVATSDIPPYSIAVGVPAKVLRRTAPLSGIRIETVPVNKF
jgi:maltose O-acetyltransferase